ncbi:MAG: peptide/nickel transport system permease protein [Acetobacteraceae bacterium]|jgi:ABC-type dipeptide/oligopeptide/nickel transport system permease subunit|nr:peptide/nickel transport system permease protein [Acetobacteraceae bacterium]MEA2774144.1 peptide/nickel transport system permease protein [Acetobacteraceae bacterium]MEA2777886.1 peptide/nickel transport system permease protein [Acetobacteraceae bacterium]
MSEAINRRLGFGLYLASNKLTAAGLILSLLLIVVAALSPLIVPHDPLDQSFLNAGQGPSADYWFGTDAFGRDVFSRVLVGGRISLSIGICAPLLAAATGVWVGMVAGYFGGWIDRTLSRGSDLLMSFPSLLLGVMIAAALGPSFQSAVIAIAIALFPRFVRLARSATQVVRREPFIDASIAAGRGPLAIIFRHILPNIAGPLVVALSLWIATAIRLEAALSFLGLGAQPPSPSWGNMIRDGMSDLVGDPWPAAFAGAAITLAVLAFNMVGDALRDMLDPELDV